MKTKYLVGLVLLIGFVSLAIYSFDSSKIEYSDFSNAENNQKTVQIIGLWVKEKSYTYDSQNNKFTFYMIDNNNKETKVIYDGPKPNNFDIAHKVVVKGKFSGHIFNASNILTKCPSKYEGKAEEVKQS